MADNPGKLSSFWKELNRRKVVRAMAMHAATAFIVIEASDIALLLVVVCILTTIATLCVPLKRLKRLAKCGEHHGNVPNIIGFILRRFITQVTRRKRRKSTHWGRAFFLNM